MDHFASTVWKQRMMNTCTLAHFPLSIEKDPSLGHGIIHCAQGFLLELT